MKTVKIYTLKDPITEEIRYVGKTTQSLNRRLTNHISDSKKLKHHCSNWIKSLLKNGYTPIIEEIDSTIETEWEYLEVYWIAQLRVWGFNLTNLTEGGDGNKGQICTEATKLKRSNTIKKRIAEGKITYAERAKKISKAHKGKKLKESTKQKLREINTGKSYSLETKKKKSKPVLQLDLNNMFIAEFYAINEASRQLGISKGAIQNVCCGRSKTAGGFKWQYKKKI